ncbi:MAG: hypothetical protein WCH39_14345 [Schlesneria sp.]
MQWHTTRTLSLDGALVTMISTVGAQDRLVSTGPQFANDVIPNFSRFGTNSSGFHEKAEGQNGFRLSVFGFDSDPSFSRESRVRRVVR